MEKNTAQRLSFWPRMWQLTVKCTNSGLKYILVVTDQINHVSRYVRDHLPGLEHGKPSIVEKCMYTVTSDSQPIMDRLGPKLVVGCGYSGSGFKHSPASGKMLAQIALGQTPPSGFQAEKCKLARF